MQSKKKKGQKKAKSTEASLPEQPVKTKVIVTKDDPFMKQEVQVKKVSDAEFIKQQKLQEVPFNSAVKFFIKHSYQDIFRRKFHFSLAFCAVYLVVVSTLVINQIISKGSIIFLKIAESTHGEIDAFVTPSADIVWKTQDGEVDIPALLNYTAVTTYYSKNDPQVLDSLLLTPRKILTGINVIKESRSGLYNETSQIQMERWHKSFDPKYNLPLRSDALHVRFESSTNDYSLVAFKTQREKEIQIGRKYNFSPMKVGECKLVSENDSQVAKEDGIKDGQIIFMKLGPINMMPYVNDYEKQFPHKMQLMTKTGLTDRALRQRERDIINAYVRMPCRVSLVEERYGKVPKSFNNAIYIEYDNFLKHLAEYLPDILDQNADFKQFLRDSPNLLDEYADQLLLQLPAPRSSHYLQSIDKVMKDIQAHIKFAEEKLGYYPISVEAFILQDFRLAEMSLVFLQLIFNLVMLLVFSISVLLIYSLLMLSVESKSFEFGVMRMVGLSKSHVIILVTMQSFLFVFPSIITGFISSFSFLQVAKWYAETYLQMDFEAIPSIGIMIQALVLSTSIPLLSSILPIQVVLDRNLNDALDIQRSKTQAVFVNILNKKKADLTPMVLFGITITLYGTVIYYMLPLALLSFRLQLMGQIFIFILVGLMFALILFAFNIQNLVERLCTHIFLFFEIESIRAMVIKNLSAHRRRNQMTGLIYSLSLGFIIFLSITCRLQIQIQSLKQLKDKASYFLVKFEDQQSLHVNTLEQIMANNIHIIDKFSWVSAPLHGFEDSYVTKATLNDLQARIEMDQDIHAIMPNYFETTISEFSSQFNDYEGEDQYVYGVPFSSDLPLAEQLYTPRGSQGVLMMAYAWQKHRSRVLRTQNQIDTGETGEAVLMLTLYSDMQKTLQYIRPIAFMDNCAGFNMLFLQGRRFSKQSMLTSLPLWSKFSRLRMDQIPMIRLHILLKEPQNKEHIQFLKKAITNSLDKVGFQGKYDIWSYLDHIDNTKEAENTLETIFTVIIVITMFICFFSLSSSMTGNLYEQCKEISVMRAIGFTQMIITKLYIYEAFILVIASSYSGIMIGTIVGWSISFLSTMIMDMPLFLLFPNREFLFIVTVSIVCAFLSTYSPSKQLMAQSIPNIAKAY